MAKTKRTNRDLMDLLISEIAGRNAPAKRQEFYQFILPLMGKPGHIDKELTDEEFEDGAAKIKAEMPAFKMFLRNYQSPFVRA